MYDAESPSAYSYTFRKARKDHRCHECRGTIKKGEKYHYHSGIWDGPCSYKICVDCESLRNDMNETIKDWDDKIPFDCLLEHVTECNEPAYIVRFVEYSLERGVNLEAWILKKYGEAKKQLESDVESL